MAFIAPQFPEVNSTTFLAIRQIQTARNRGCRSRLNAQDDFPILSVTIESLPPGSCER